jgi:hypothetical protein
MGLAMIDRASSLVVQGIRETRKHVTITLRWLSNPIGFHLVQYKKDIYIN